MGILMDKEIKFLMDIEEDKIMSLVMDLVINLGQEQVSITFEHITT